MGAIKFSLDLAFANRRALISRYIPQNKFAVTISTEKPIAPYHIENWSELSTSAAMSVIQSMFEVARRFEKIVDSFQITIRVDRKIKRSEERRVGRECRYE